MYICFCILCKGSENRLDNQIFCEFNCVCNCNYCVFAPLGTLGMGLKKAFNHRLNAFFIVIECLLFIQFFSLFLLDVVCNWRCDEDC